jgi:hypothetical protein
VSDDELELAPGLRDLLADEATWSDPAPGGADALLAAIRSTPPGQRPAAPGPAPGPAPAAAPARRPRVGLRVLAAAAVVAVVAAVAGVVLTVTGGDDGAAREVAIGGTELAPDASAVASVEELGSGLAIELDVRGLPPAAPGTYYQAWVRSPDGATVTVGTFHMRAGDEVVELWAGVDLDDYPILTVTLQQEGAGAESSGRVVLMGEIGETGGRGR